MYHKPGNASWKRNILILKVFRSPSLYEGSLKILGYVFFASVAPDFIRGSRNKRTNSDSAWDRVREKVRERRMWCLCAERCLQSLGRAGSVLGNRAIWRDHGPSVENCLCCISGQSFWSQKQLSEGGLLLSRLPISASPLEVDFLFVCACLPQPGGKP